MSLPSNRSTMDLMIVDISNNLSISNLSSLPSFVLQWNKCQPSFLNVVFDFTSRHVHDKDAVLFFHSNDVKIKIELKGFMKAYQFMVFKEWMGISRLYMISAKDKSKMVNLAYTFWIFIFSLFLVNAILKSSRFFI